MESSVTSLDSMEIDPTVPNLTNLPELVLHEVTTHLDYLDLFNLKLSCKALNQQLSHKNLHECCQVIDVDLEDIQVDPENPFVCLSGIWFFAKGWSQSGNAKLGFIDYDHESRHQYHQDYLLEFSKNTDYLFGFTETKPEVCSIRWRIISGGYRLSIWSMLEAEDVVETAFIPTENGLFELEHRAEKLEVDFDYMGDVRGVIYALDTKDPTSLIIKHPASKRYSYKLDLEAEDRGKELFMRTKMVQSRYLIVDVGNDKILIYDTMDIKNRVTRKYSMDYASSNEDNTDYETDSQEEEAIIDERHPAPKLIRILRKNESRWMFKYMKKYQMNASLYPRDYTDNTFNFLLNQILENEGEEGVPPKYRIFQEWNNVFEHCRNIPLKVLQDGGYRYMCRYENRILYYSPTAEIKFKVVILKQYMLHDVDYLTSL